MLSALESISIIAGSILAALLVLLVFRRYWLSRIRGQHNDVLGWQVSFLSTTYAVVIAFMLSDVWGNYQAAQTNAEVEANALLSLYRVAVALPPQARDEMQSLGRRYAETMVREEWPAMLRGDLSPAGFQITSDLWKVLMATQTRNAVEATAFGSAVSDLTNLVEHRHIRLLQSHSKLPGIFWIVLIVGGVLTVLYTCLFDVEEFRMHVVQVIGVAFIVSLILVTIADVDGPFGGAVRILPAGFEMALQSMHG